MKIARWLIGRWSKVENKSNTLNELERLIHEAYGHSLSSEYEKARTTLLDAIKYRDDIKDVETTEYILTTIEATWLLTGEYEDAIDFFSEYLKRYPLEAGAYRGRGSARWYLGKLPEALEDYSRALQLNPDDVNAHSGRGHILVEIGEPAQALEALDRSLQILNMRPITNAASALWFTQVEAFIRNGRGAALAGLGKNEAAMDEFKESILLCPNNAWVYDNRGRAYDRIGNLGRARLDYETALEKSEPPLSRTRRNFVQERLRQLPVMSD